MRYHQFSAPLLASLLAMGSLGVATAAPNTTGSGSSGTTEGRVEGSTNSNSMGEPAKTAKDKPAKKKAMRKPAAGANSDMAPGQPDPTKNGSPKGEAGKTP